ncbi:60s acidic ribosomal protein p0 [Holotrichia oblita]|uniref:60s acidic ribosomal protein p0 n=1 Tax=Holotrichia oblita TaxID=644536 RepID=A0ACB9TGE5_HOLOL|nr:60s acidic ribosomal protein p0 [Holotrichia oblita]
MGREDKATWKSNYFTKLIQLLEDFPKCFIVGADNVGSKQMQQIRMSLRGNAVVLMGKNTMMRKAIKGHLERNPSLEKLLPHIKGNVGFVFTRADLVEVRDKLLENKVRAPARPGAIAPLSVIIPAQNTGLGPEKTSFFQALSIPTKISKGTIEIINDVHILKPGDKVGASEATLLNMLNISPFSYGLIVEQVYDSGTIFAPEILDIKPEDLRERFMVGVANLAAVCLTIGYPTIASAPHSIANGFKNLLAIAAATDVDFKEATTIKEFIKDIPYKKIVIFVDNAGVDFVLGVIPFAREFIKEDAKVILSANTYPALNDITISELNECLLRASLYCPVIKDAVSNNKLVGIENGQGGPCLDLTSLNEAHRRPLDIRWMSATDMPDIDLRSIGHPTDMHKTSINGRPMDIQ